MKPTKHHEEIYRNIDRMVQLEQTISACYAERSRLRSENERLEHLIARERGAKVIPLESYRNRLRYPRKSTTTNTPRKAA